MLFIKLTAYSGFTNFTEQMYIHILHTYPKVIRESACSGHAYSRDVCYNGMATAAIC